METSEGCLLREESVVSVVVPEMTATLTLLQTRFELL